MHARRLALTLVLLLAAIAAAHLSAGPLTAQAPPVAFLDDPALPPYAGTALTLHPDPPAPGEPAELCGWLVNNSAQPVTVTVEFGVAPFGIGLEFAPVGSRELVVPANGRARACVGWVPEVSGRWCISADLYQGDAWPVLHAVRNVDNWEVLEPGVPAVTNFPLRNPLTQTATIHLEALRVLAGWEASITPAGDTRLAAGEIIVASLVVTPPVAGLLGSRRPIVDVEATALLVPTPQSIGGFRKMDWTPVPLHRPQDPPYAESEISVAPYPPLAGEPTHICVALRNISLVPRPLDVEFAIANFGLGLPFHPVAIRGITIPAEARSETCIWWVPPVPGQFGVQASLSDPTGAYSPQTSRRVMDVNEVLMPGERSSQPFAVGNPLQQAGTISLTVISYQPGWSISVDPALLTNVMPGDVRVANLLVTPPMGPLPDDGELVADVEAYLVSQEGTPTLIGGFRKIFRPPIPLHRPFEPVYAESEISIEPYPPRAGEPTYICVELRNPTNVSRTVGVEFGWAPFGIGVPFNPIQHLSVTILRWSQERPCIVWVPPFGGQFSARVTLTQPGYHPIVSQRTVDVSEVLRPGIADTFRFMVVNPFPGRTITVSLGTVLHLPGWQADLSSRVLTNLSYGSATPVTLTVVPGDDAAALPDGTPVLDVEGLVDGRLLGGFRKLYRPPIPVHRPQDPIYAESEISINPYPPAERQPTQICVELRNPTSVSQTMTVTLQVARFGIGMDFHDIARPMTVTLAAQSTRRVCIIWVPPYGGQFCAQATIQVAGHDPVYSQRNMDVNEVLRPGIPSTIVFPVRNSTGGTVTVTLGAVPRGLNWAYSLSSTELGGMAPGAVRPVTLVVTPTAGVAMPEDETPVIDVEGYVGGELIGGFRKMYRPPVPIHVPQDPVYAESELFVDPYPVLAGVPTLLGAIVYNPTQSSQQVTVTLEVANFGIGLPFTTTGILTPTQVVTIPPLGAVRVRTVWLPPGSGLACVQVTIQTVGHNRVVSRRNIDVGEPLRPGQPHSRVIAVRNPLPATVTMTLALINYRQGWSMSLTPSVLTNMAPGATRPVTLTVEPSSWEGVADEQPVVDVEAYVDGRLVGGIRKLAKPPVPLHRLQDRPYAETELSVSPSPIRAGLPHTITVRLVNSGETSQTVTAEFGVANFGFGIPFTTTNIVPVSRTVTLDAGEVRDVWVRWTPPFEGHWCIRVALTDPQGEYPAQVSQRNVEVVREPYQPCDPLTKDFWLQNSTGTAVTVTLGTSAINLPSGWTYSTSITETVLGPYQGITVTVTMTPPCNMGAGLVGVLTAAGGGASDPPMINVEGYVNGQMLGGIQIELAEPRRTYLPVVMRTF